MTNATIAKKVGTQTPPSPRQVAETYFSSLEQGRIQDAQVLLDQNVSGKTFHRRPASAIWRHGWEPTTVCRRL